MPTGGVRCRRSWKPSRSTRLGASPPGHHAIGLKRVYKVKKDAHGVVLKHKARLVAKGYVQ
ncbi:hypothetical protein JBE27_57995 [Streptomyces albiflaviniger]|nr:hypothetical protein [Streptomyces albiflaviniger]